MLRFLVLVSLARSSDALCVELDNATATDGMTLSMGYCDGSEKQQWSVRLGQIFYAADPSKCVDLLGGDSSSGQRLGLWDCYSGQNQMWSFDDEGAMRWGRDQSKCIVYTSQSHDLRIWDCDDLPDEMISTVRNDFSFAGDANLCVGLPSGDIENGTFLPMGYCDGRQQWSFQGGQMKYTADPTKCVDLLGGVPSSGSLLGLWDCFSGEHPDLQGNQLWSFDNNGTMHWGKDQTKCIIYAGLSDNLRIWDCDKRRDWMTSVVREDFSSPEILLVI